MLTRFEPFRRTDANLATDAYRRGDRCVIRLDVPGVAPESIELTAERDVITVEAERQGEGAEGDRWYLAERPQGRFQRRFVLGQSLDADRLEASYEHGVLTLAVPVREAARARRVPVASGDAGPALEGGEPRPAAA